MGVECVKRIFIIACGWLVLSCGDFHFEALSTGQKVDTGEPEQTDTKEAVVVVKHKPVPQDSLFDGDKPDLDGYVELPVQQVGNGTADSCDEGTLRQAITAINSAGEGKIEFHCGNQFHRILLNGPLIINPGVRIFVSGTLNDSRKPDVALDGRDENPIFVIGEETDVAIERMTFVNAQRELGSDGGAIRVVNETLGGKLILSECVFKHNTAKDKFGGAVYAEQLLELYIYRSVFEDNYAVSGGALFLYETMFNITNSYFIGNFVDYEGGAIFMENADAEVAPTHLLRGNWFSANRADEGGSAVKAQQSEPVDLVVEQCEFESNQVDKDQAGNSGGGALSMSGGRLLLDSSSFQDNISSANSAAVWVNSDRGFEIVNCTFYNNESTRGLCGALYQSDKNQSIIRNATFYQNRGIEYGAIYSVNTDGLSISSTVFVNNIIDPFASRSCNATFLEGANFAGDEAQRVSSNIQFADNPASDRALCTPMINQSNPNLSPPQKNGGFVSTCGVTGNSSAAGVGADCADNDARGEERVDAPDKCYAGAYEYVSVSSLDN